MPIYLHCWALEAVMICICTKAEEEGTVRTGKTPTMVVDIIEQPLETVDLCSNMVAAEEEEESKPEVAAVSVSRTTTDMSDGTIANEASAAMEEVVREVSDRSSTTVEQVSHHSIISMVTVKSGSVAENDTERPTTPRPHNSNNSSTVEMLPIVGLIIIIKMIVTGILIIITMVDRAVEMKRGQPLLGAVEMLSGIIVAYRPAWGEVAMATDKDDHDPVTTGKGEAQRNMTAEETPMRLRDGIIPSIRNHRSNGVRNHRLAVAVVIGVAPVRSTTRSVISRIANTIPMDKRRTSGSVQNSSNSSNRSSRIVARIATERRIANGNESVIGNEIVTAIATVNVRRRKSRRKIRESVIARRKRRIVNATVTGERRRSAKRNVNGSGIERGSAKRSARRSSNRSERRNATVKRKRTESRNRNSCRRRRHAIPARTIGVTRRRSAIKRNAKRRRKWRSGSTKRRERKRIKSGVPRITARSTGWRKTGRRKSQIVRSNRQHRRFDQMRPEHRQRWWRMTVPVVRQRNVSCRTVAMNRSVPRVPPPVERRKMTRKRSIRIPLNLIESMRMPPSRTSINKRRLLMLSRRNRNSNTSMGTIIPICTRTFRTSMKRINWNVPYCRRSTILAISNSSFSRNIANWFSIRKIT
uniref:Uncharacterized protein n=1 Tax=Anopheles marajoara TaxID=58244 RepID=A0A2M4BGZ3_9DIPT